MDVSIIINFRFYLTVCVFDSRDVRFAEGALNEAEYERGFANSAGTEHHHPIIVALFRHVSGGWLFGEIAVYLFIFRPFSNWWKSNGKRSIFTTSRTEGPIWQLVVTVIVLWDQRKLLYNSPVFFARSFVRGAKICLKEGTRLIVKWIHMYKYIASR